ncbi:MAG: hypothetical protein K6U08_10250 [Firmicutes bacterium]|nr:hypothetical protein [Bacillota bacterium]
MLGSTGLLLDARSDRERQQREGFLVDSLAEEFTRAGLGRVAVFVAEASKPLAGLGAHLIRLLDPVLGVVADPLRLANLACLIERRGNLERLIRRVEALEAAPRLPPASGSSRRPDRLRTGDRKED